MNIGHAGGEDDGFDPQRIKDIGIGATATGEELKLAAEPRRCSDSALHQKGIGRDGHTGIFSDNLIKGLRTDQHAIDSPRRRGNRLFDRRDQLPGLSLQFNRIVTAHLSL